MKSWKLFALDAVQICIGRNVLPRGAKDIL